MRAELVRTGSPSVLTKAGRQASREVSIAAQRALVRAAHVRAVAVVTQVGMQEVAGLTNLEGNLLRQVPLAEDRLRALADTGTSVMASLIHDMRRV